MGQKSTKPAVTVIAKASALETGQDHCYQAQQAMKQGQLEKASTLYASSIKDLKQALLDTKNPDMVKGILSQAYLEQGNLFEKLQKINSARISYDEAQKLGNSQARGKLQALVAAQTAAGEKSDAVTPPSRTVSAVVDSKSAVDAKDAKLSSPVAVVVSPSTPSLQLPLIFKKNPVVIDVTIEPLPVDSKADIKDSRILVKLLKTTDQKSERYAQLQKLALDVIGAFSKAPVKTPALIKEVMVLSQVDDKSIARELLSKLIDPIKKDVLPHPSMIKGLAAAIKTINPLLLEPDDLIQILQVINERIKGAHKQNDVDKRLHQILVALADLFDAMVDVNLKGMKRVQLHQELHDNLDGLKDHNNKTLAHLAAYVQQALVRIPNDETKLRSALRRTWAFGNALSDLATAVSDMSPSDLVSAFQNFSEAFQMQAWQSGWYDELRFAELLLKGNQFLGFEYFVKQSKSRTESDFCWGIFRLLRQTLATHSDYATRTHAFEFLAQMFVEEQFWGKHESLRIGILVLLTQYATHPDAALRQAVQHVLLQLQKNTRLTEEQQKLLKQNVPLLAHVSPRAAKAVLPFSTALMDSAQQKVQKAVDKKLDTIVNQGKDSKAVLDDTHDKVNVLLEKLTFSPSHQDQFSHSVEEKIMQLRQRVLNDQDTKEELASYIPARGAHRITDAHTFDMEQEVENYLKSDKKVLLIIGSAGGGKSTFNRFLAYQLWSKFKLGDPIPFFISLPNLHSPEKELLIEYLMHHGFTEKEVQFVIQKYKLRLILDGYDEMRIESEMNRFKNLYISNRMGDWPSPGVQVIVTCRTEHLTKYGNYQRFFVPGNNQKLQNNALMELTVVPFNDQQIKDYITKFLQIQQAKGQESVLKDLSAEWRKVETYLTHIENIPGMKVLITNPFLLMIAMDVMPDIVEKYKHLEEGERKKMTGAALYDAFVNKWFQRQSDKITVDGNDPADGHDVTADFMEFSKQLAKDMFNSKVQRVFFQSVVSPLNRAKQQQETWADKYFGDEAVTAKKYFNGDKEMAATWALARTGCPLKQVAPNTWAFIHATFMEYFVTRADYDDMLNEAPAQQMGSIPSVSEAGGMMMFGAVKKDAKDAKESGSNTATAAQVASAASTGTAATNTLTPK